MILFEKPNSDTFSAPPVSIQRETVLAVLDWQAEGERSHDLTGIQVRSCFSLPCSQHQVRSHAVHEHTRAKSPTAIAFASTGLLTAWDAVDIEPQLPCCLVWGKDYLTVDGTAC